MKQFLEDLLQKRRTAKRQPVTLEELNRRQAYMNSPAFYASLGHMGSCTTPLMENKNV